MSSNLTLTHSIPDTFPTELIQAINGLNNENRQNILLHLYKRPKLSFSELVLNTGINDALISTHLRILKDSMLLEQFYEHINGRDEYSFYKITHYGRQILNGLFNIFYIIKKKREIELYLKITDEVTAISPDTYMNLDGTSKISSDTAEGIKEIIQELLSE